MRVNYKDFVVESDFPHLNNENKKSLHTCGLIVQFRLLSNQFTLLRIYFFFLPFFFLMYIKIKQISHQRA